LVFWHRLALALGGTVGELQERMPHREFLDWVALYQIEPWGETRADMNAAMLASLTANLNRDKKKRSKPFGPADFMPDFWRRMREPAHRAEGVASKAMAIFAQMAGKKDE
jgi:hypothetical protein